MNASVDRVLTALRDGGEISPDDLIATSEQLNRLMGAAISPPDESEATEGQFFRYSVNASFMGGYSEAVAGSLFTAKSQNGFPAWRQAVSMKTAGYWLGDKSARLELAGWPSNSPAVDLLVSREDFLTGRWRPAADTDLTPGLRALIGSSKPQLTVQVKARVARDPESADDALPYPYFLSARHDRTLTRQDLLAPTFAGWNDPALDLVVWVQWLIDDPAGATPLVRMAAGQDVRDAIRLIEGSTATRTERPVWSSRKINFRQVFGTDLGPDGIGVEVSQAVRDLPPLSIPVETTI